MTPSNPNRKIICGSDPRAQRKRPPSVGAEQRAEFEDLSSSKEFKTCPSAGQGKFP
jgi:hypothetical protein